MAVKILVFRLKRRDQVCLVFFGLVELEMVYHGCRASARQLGVSIDFGDMTWMIQHIHLVNINVISSESRCFAVLLEIEMPRLPL